MLKVTNELGPKFSIGKIIGYSCNPLSDVPWTPWFISRAWNRVIGVQTEPTLQPTKSNDKLICPMLGDLNDGSHFCRPRATFIGYDIKDPRARCLHQETVVRRQPTSSSTS